MSRRDWVESELEKLRQQSIARHAPFLLPAEEEMLMPSEAELAARKFMCSLPGLQPITREERSLLDEIYLNNIFGEAA